VVEQRRGFGALLMPARMWISSLGVAAAGMLALTSPTAAPAPASAAATKPAVALQALSFVPALAKAACPVERGPVKEGSDADKGKVLTTLTATTISNLSGKAKPSSYPTNARIAPVELHKYLLRNVILRQYRIETDGDIHLVLGDGHGHHMIAEIPHHVCTAGSRWRSAITSARSVFTPTLPVSTDWHYVSRRISIRGVALFDIRHGQTGVAANGIELHPVIGVHFG
jgi:hypothetical protein